jgi:peptidyl-prolyl cis-trans isomerase C
MTNRYCPVAVCVLCGWLALAGAGAASAQTNASAKLQALFGDDVVAKGQGFEIKRSMLDESVVTIRSSAAGRGNDIAAPAMQRLEREVLRRLINIALLMQRATDEDRTQGREQAEKRITQLTERAGSADAMSRQLKAVGLTPERLREKLIEEATAEVVLQRELKIAITDAQVKAYYDENPARFEKPEMVRAAHILLSTRNPETNQELSAADKEAKRTQIEGLLKRARQGENFAELAAQYSEDPGSKEKGGEYTFPRGRMVPEFEAAAFSLSPGQVSDVITTPFGYHIIKLYEKIPASTVELNETVQGEVRDFLKARELQKQMEPFMEKLSAESEVVILDERLKPQPGDTAPAEGKP